MPDKSKVNKCPKCFRKPIHARALDWPMLDQEGLYGWSLKVECPEHGWQDNGDGWTYDDLVEAGLKGTDYHA